MKLVEFVPPCPHPLWTLCRQMGIEEVVVKVNPSLTGLPAPWRLATLKKIVDGLAAEGLRVIGLEGDPFDMTPIKQFGEVAPRADADSLPSRGASRGATPVLSSAAGASPLPSVSSITAAAREEALARYRELLDSMAALDIRLLCYNFMVGPGWSRTGVRAVRGGALATYFSLAETEKSTPMKTEGFATVSPSEKAGTVVEALAQSELKLTHAQVKVVSDKSHWFYDLDVLSISAYVPARPQGCTNDLSVADMMANLAPLRDKLRRVAKIYGKPMMFGECGCGECAWPFVCPSTRNGGGSPPLLQGAEPAMKEICEKVQLLGKNNNCASGAPRARPSACAATGERPSGLQVRVAWRCGIWYHYHQMMRRLCFESMGRKALVRRGRSRMGAFAHGSNPPPPIY